MGVDPRRQLDRVTAAVRRFRPDCVLATGDIAHDGAAASYRAAREAFAGTGCPVHAIPGNHDDPGLLARELGAWPLVRPVGPWRLVLLNTHVRGRESGAIRGAELEAAAAALDARPSGPVLVALHHPPVAVGSPWIDAMGLEGADALLDWCRRRGDVHVIVGGHVHQAAFRRRDATRVLTAPATCVQFAPRTRECRILDRRPAWRALQLHRDGSVETRVHRLGPRSAARVECSR